MIFSPEDLTHDLRDLKLSFPQLNTGPLHLSEHPYWHGFEHFHFGCYNGGWQKFGGSGSREGDIRVQSTKYNVA